MIPIYHRRPAPGGGMQPACQDQGESRRHRGHLSHAEAAAGAQLNIAWLLVRPHTTPPDSASNVLGKPTH
jgi:hypothetical protein